MMAAGEDQKGAPTRRNKPGGYFGIPLPIWVVVFMAGGLIVGAVFPGNRVTTAIYTSGTLFPKAVVTFATLVIFALLAGATAKLVLFHRHGAGRLFGLILAAYVALGLASLVYVTLWIPILAKLPLAAPGVALLGFGTWVRQVGHSFSTLFSDQPLLQVLVAAVVTGYAAATIRVLHSVAQGLMWASETTLWLFKKLLWYYPVMIGCLAIGIPMKFGVKGMTAYGRVTLWVGLVTVSWSVILASLVMLTTKRSFKQLLSYYANVWPTGFGTGGSYETLAMNVISAEHDLGLRREVAEVSIVFGTVMNKSCATMCVMLVTIIVCRLLNIPIGLAEILMLIPPVLVLGLESPGIPGGAAFFMSPIVAVLLQVRDVEVFVATFVTMYSGLIPMFSTAGNTTNDGLVGAWINDRFAHFLKSSESPLPRPQGSVSAMRAGESLRPRKLAGWVLMTPAIWMLVSPQAVLGLSQLKWMYKYAFRGEVVIGVFVMSVALYLLGAQSTPEGAGQLRPESLPRPQSSDTPTGLT
jgi:Na+/H+-dicarboxylate symporter